MLAPVLAAIDAQRREVVRRQHVGHLEVRIGRIGVQDERVVALAEIAGVLAVRHVAAGVADRPRQQHVRRHVAVRTFQLAEHTADVRMLDAALEEAAGLHHLMAGVVDGGGRVIHAADERELVRVLGHAREVLGDLDARDVGLDGLVRAADLGRSVRLHVPGVELGRPADQEQHDAVDVLLPSTAPCAFRPNREFRVRPSAEREPACRKSRRRSPSQNSTARSASRRSMSLPSKRGNRGSIVPLMKLCGNARFLRNEPDL